MICNLSSLFRSNNRLLAIQVDWERESERIYNETKRVMINIRNNNRRTERNETKWIQNQH